MVRTTNQPNEGQRRKVRDRPQTGPSSVQGASYLAALAQ